MKGVFSIQDTMAGCYTSPFIEHNDATAVRMFTELVSDPKTVFSKHPECYQLVCIGFWDELDGKLLGESPRSITNGASCAVKMGS